MTSSGRRVLTVLILLQFSFNLRPALAQVATGSDTAAVRIETGKPVDREIRGGEMHRYHVALLTGQFLQAVVDQRGIDVVVTVRDPVGKEIEQIDSPNGSQGPEPIGLEATVSGLYRLEIKSIDPNATPGNYQVRIDKILSPAENAERIAKRLADYESVKEWIRSNAIPIRTVEAGNGFGDLHPLKRLIGDAHIIALGEATHGTREFFQLKHRLLEFLVTEMGFSVFGIEAPMPEGYDVNEYVLTGKGDPEKALAGMYYWFYDSEEMLAMLRWMRKYNADVTHTRKIKFYGFDMVSTFRAVTGTLEYLERVDPEQASLARSKMDFLANMYSMRYFRTLSGEQKRNALGAARNVLDLFDEHYEDYISRSNIPDWILARQYVNIIVQNLTNQMSPPTHPVRDSAMAENVRWILRQEGTDAKIVLWGHNGHVGRTYLSAGSMGWHLRKMFGEDFVSVGFAFNQGSFRAMDLPPSTAGLRSFMVHPSPDGTFDATCAAAGLSIAAINFHDIPGEGPAADWFKSPQSTRNIGAGYSERFVNELLGFHVSQLLPLTYDAMFFVETTTPVRSKAGGQIPTVTLDQSKNLDFESGQAEDPPPGWALPTGLPAFNFETVLSGNAPKSGNWCAVIRRLAGTKYGETYGSLSQRVDAAPYRGKRVRLGVWVRVEPKGRADKAYLWLRIVTHGSSSQGQAFYDNMADRPITNARWREHEISGDVPAEATTIEYGLAFVGDGAAYFDDVSLDASAE